MINTMYHLEMKEGQPSRHVDADHWRANDGWMVFYRKHPQGGIQEYWRVRTDCVVSVETVLP